MSQPLFPDAYEWTEDELGDWRGKAYRAIAKLAKTGEEFSAADVWDAVGQKPHEPRHMGGVMTTARAAGLIESVGVQVTRSALRNRGYETVWRGVAS